MAQKPEIVRLSRSERLRKSRPQGTSMSLPLAVHHRLDLLAQEAADVDATRAEIVAMLICEAPMDSEFLERAILNYRKLTVGDVVPPEEDAPKPLPLDRDNVVSIRRHGPGRRSAS